MRSLAVMSLPAASRAVVLLTCAATAVVLAVSFATLAVDLETAGRAAFLFTAALMTAAMSGSLRRGRNSSPRLLTTDSCWMLPAAVLLPWPLLAPLALVTRLSITYLQIGVRPGFKLIFNLCVASLAAASAGAAALLVLPREWTTSEPEPRVVVLGLILAGLVHLAVDQLVVLAVWLSEPAMRWREARGAPTVDAVEAALVCVGALLTPLLAQGMAYAVLALPIPLVLHSLIGAGVLWQKADRDAKTGLLNPVAWASAARRTLARGAAAGVEAAVVLVDLDHFKRVNDQHGHLAGDVVLHATAQALRDGLRPDSLLARFGGEEFVMLLPEVDAAAAGVAAERLRGAIEELAVPVAGALVRVTASFGVAAARPGDDLNDVLARADRAVYDAKRGGRNQVVLAAAEAVPGREPC